MNASLPQACDLVLRVLVLALVPLPPTVIVCFGLHACRMQMGCWEVGGGWRRTRPRGMASVERFRLGVRGQDSQLALARCCLEFPSGQSLPPPRLPRGLFRGLVSHAFYPKIGEWDELAACVGSGVLSSSRLCSLVKGAEPHVTVCFQTKPVWEERVSSENESTQLPFPGTKRAHSLIAYLLSYLVVALSSRHI